MITRSLTGTVEISTAALTLSSRPPTFTGENGALAVELSFLNNGSAASLSGYVAEMYLYWPERREMTDSITMSINGSVASGVFTEELTVLPGAPLLIVQLSDTGTGELIVACAQPIQITATRGDQVITTRPPTPSEIIYVGRSPYVDLVTGHWMEWDTGTGAYVDTGVNAKGDTGTSIVSIAKTGTSGIVDTYTILFSDGNSTTFTVTNGAQISSISKTGTSGLVDTYTVTMTNSDTFTFTVTNGRGISGIAKTGTSGIVDTYTVTYNDTTTSTFTVTNGNGITSSAVSYQASSSGTIVPSGTWFPNPPAVSQGAYLWTKTVLTFDGGGTETSYSVAYQGMDGSGAVQTVDSIAPVSGNVTLPLMTGATSSSNGAAGKVPAPAAGDEGKFLRGDASWQDVPNPATMTGATASTAGTGGLVPAPAAGDQDKRLAGDGTWRKTWDTISLSIASTDWASGQSWPSGSAPLGESSATCYLATKTTDANSNTISCADGDSFIVSEYDQAKCPAPLWVYVGANTIYIATTGTISQSVSIRGAILHK